MKFSKSILGVSRFDDAKMAKFCRQSLVKRIQECRADPNKHLTKEEGTEFARDLQKWALGEGCHSFSHWFNPMRGMHGGEKHDTLMDMDDPVTEMTDMFTGGKIFQAETDGSSFPNGGMRGTHEAGAYTAWDMNSAPFIYEKTLFLPSAFISWQGSPLDEKTPLLRSQTALDKSAKKFLKTLGQDVKKVRSNVGWEQEFFLVPRELYDERPDLIHSERTLFGALPPLNQQTSKHYFGKQPVSVREFLAEVREELWKVGTNVTVVHNEVAPAQHELCPVFTMSSVAADQNRFGMSLMKEVANRHGLAVLFHEKPFKGVNGSGKHTNYSISINDTNEQLFSPGKTELSQKRFMAFMAAITRAVDVYPELLRCSVASAGNDHRLGAQEAPPSIISISLGKAMTDKVEKIIASSSEPLSGFGGDDKIPLQFGSDSVNPVSKPDQDRNRTSVLPFCQNRFEFRAVGSNQLINFATTTLNAAIAEGLDIMTERMEKGESLEEVVRDLFSKHHKSIFNGDGYSAEWVKEAEKRGLPNLVTTVDALDEYLSDKNVNLFVSQGILDVQGMESRSEVMYQQYIDQILIEAETSRNMLESKIIPAVIEHIQDHSFGEYEFVQEQLTKLRTLHQKVADLKTAINEVDEDAPLEKQARYAMEVVKAKMDDARVVADSLENQIQYWPYPSYSDLFYSHHD